MLSCGGCCAVSLFRFDGRFRVAGTSSRPTFGELVLMDVTLLAPSAQPVSSGVYGIVEQVFQGSTVRADPMVLDGHFWSLAFYTCLPIPTLQTPHLCSLAGLRRRACFRNTVFEARSCGLRSRSPQYFQLVITIEPPNSLWRRS